jgi:hypothetical protein
MNPNETRLRLIAELKELLVVLENGCSDSCCELVKSGPGMHTNGGCRCWFNINDRLMDCNDFADKFNKRGINRRCHG